MTMLRICWAGPMMTNRATGLSRYHALEDFCRGKGMAPTFQGGQRTTAGTIFLLATGSHQQGIDAFSMWNNISYIWDTCARSAPWRDPAPEPGMATHPTANPSMADTHAFLAALLNKDSVCEWFAVIGPYTLLGRMHPMAMIKQLARTAADTGGDGKQPLFVMDVDSAGFHGQRFLLCERTHGAAPTRIASTCASDTLEGERPPRE